MLAKPAGFPNRGQIISPHLAETTQLNIDLKLILIIGSVLLQFLLRTNAYGQDCTPPFIERDESGAITNLDACNAAMATNFPAALALSGWELVSSRSVQLKETWAF